MSVKWIACNTASSTCKGIVTSNSVSQKYGRTTCHERLSAEPTERSSMVMTGPTSDKNVKATTPGTTNTARPASVTTASTTSAAASRPNGSTLRISEMLRSGCPCRCAPTTLSRIPAYTTTPAIENTAEAADVTAAPTGRDT